MDKTTLRTQIINALLGRQEKYILLLMCEYSTDGVVNVSENQLAYIANYHVKRVNRAVSALVVRGVLELISERGWDGHTALPSTYRIHIENARQMPPFARSAVRPGKSTKKDLIARTGAVCAYCRKPGDSKNGPDGLPWTIDRLIPRARGGRYEEGNMTLACHSCNRRKGQKAA